MGILHIYCSSCNSEWVVYRRNLCDKGSRECPHCGAKINQDVWAKAYAAVAAMDNFNLEIMQSASPLMFEVSYEANGILRNVADERLC